MRAKHRVVRNSQGLVEDQQRGRTVEALLEAREQVGQQPAWPLGWASVPPSRSTAQAKNRGRSCVRIQQLPMRTAQHMGLQCLTQGVRLQQHRQAREVRCSTGALARLARPTTRRRARPAPRSHPRARGALRPTPPPGRGSHPGRCAPAGWNTIRRPGPGRSARRPAPAPWPASSPMSKAGRARPGSAGTASARGRQQHSTCPCRRANHQRVAPSPMCVTSRNGVAPSVRVTISGGPSVRHCAPALPHGRHRHQVREVQR